jgi:AAA domain
MTDDNDNIIDFNDAKRQSQINGGEVSAQDIRQRLHANPRAFIEWLFSGRAYCTKNEARIGNVSGEPGASLSIKLVGGDAGLWIDHATHEKGDLIALYRAFMGYTDKDGTFVQSLTEIAKDFFHDTIEVRRPAWGPTANDRIRENKAKHGTKPREDLVELGAPVATYRYFDTRGHMTASVVRYEPDGTRASKTFRPYCYRLHDGKMKWSKGAPDLRPLYRIPEISLASTVVLVEGEGCADALAHVGIDATTAMQGAHAPIDRTDWSPLAGKTVIIWPDNDAPGMDYARAVSGRLAAIGCRVLGVNIPLGKPSAWDAADCVAEGGNPADLIAAAVDVTPPKPRIRLLTLDEIEAIEPPVFLIEGVLPKGGLSMIWGRSGALKSFVALDAGMCIATGMPWHGKAVKQGLVIYLAAEGSHGLGRRAIGWMRTRGRDVKGRPKFRLIPQSLALVSNEDLVALLQAIAALGEMPVLIIIDTVARTFGAGDENKQADMNAYVGAADRLREATGAHVMVVHHSGVHEDKRERGSNVLRGAADTIIKVSRQGDKIDLINRGPEGKQKDAEEFKTVKLESRAVAFVPREGQSEQTTLVLNTREEGGTDSAEVETEEEDVTLGKVEKAVFAALVEAGEPCRLQRVVQMTSRAKGSVLRALGTLVDKELVTVDFAPDGNSKLWCALDG